MISSIFVETGKKTEVVNVTQALADMVDGVQDGIALFYVPHTTATLVLCEEDDELNRDLVKVAEHWLEPLKPFEHIRKNNPNTAAHVLSAFGGASLLLAIEDGRLDLGTYQNVLLLEMDGPKQRQVRCKVIQG
jgi:secondary thiamine-phosphate synthase enzyme